jgi:hypothetical protein
MPSYEIKYRVIHPTAVATIEALHREDAVAQVVMQAVADGDEVQVSNVTEVPGTPPPAP